MRFQRELRDYFPADDASDRLDATYPEKGLRGLNWKGRLGFRLQLVNHRRILYSFMRRSRKSRACFVGPFYGEFGNFLLHFLPFISYLHREGVSVNVCLLDRYLPFLVDGGGNKLYSDAVLLPADLLSGLPPASANYLKHVPEEFRYLINSFVATAVKLKLPILRLDHANLYWYSFRNWQLHGRQHYYSLSCATKKNNKVVVFARKKGQAVTSNNGEILDYTAIADTLSIYFDEVVFVGHPEMTASVAGTNEKVKLKVGDNKTVLTECAEASLIVSQHSGAIHVGLYTGTPALIVFKGELPIKGLADTMRFRENKRGVPLFLITEQEQLGPFCKLYLNSL